MYVYIVKTFSENTGTQALVVLEAPITLETKD